jgi:hypothetical protein
MGDETCTHDLADKSSKIWSDDSHLGDKIAVKGLSVVGETDDSLSKQGDIFQV